MLAAAGNIENPEVLFYLGRWRQADGGAITRNETEALPCFGYAGFNMCGYDFIEL